MIVCSFLKFNSKIFLINSKVHRRMASLVGTPESECHLTSNMNHVKRKMAEAAAEVQRSPTSISLVAVSKTKPFEDIMKLYSNGHRKFGENYFQELVEKAEALPQDISWNFIGHLQSSKASKLIRAVPNLAVVETVDSIKLASKLNNACESIDRQLDIYIQVHTSDEDTKSGVPPAELISLVGQIRSECPRLNIRGCMTIGSPGDVSCFDTLAACRIEMAEFLHVSPDSLDLSMGMSGDFEDAIKKGATSVRVGSIIFGARDYSK